MKSGGLLSVVLAVCLPLLLAAQERVDLSVVQRIKAEAFSHSKVMETAFYLSDVLGPRLTGSEALRKAGEWSIERMNAFGLTNTHLEPWGPFGRSWANTRFSAHLIEPQYAPIIGVARPMSRGMEGPLIGEPVLAPLRTEADFAQYKGKLRGKIVFLDEPRVLQPQSAPLMHRYTEEDLEKIGQAPDPTSNAGPYDPTARNKFRHALNAFLNDEGVAVTVSMSSTLSRQDPGRRIEGGTLFATPVASLLVTEPSSPPAATIAAEHYNRIARLIEKKIPVKVEFEIRNTLSDTAVDSFSVIGEIRGTTKAGEVVIIGGHLDSHMFGTGATDNAAGCAVVLEAMRILKTLNLKLARTVRVGLWTGEEQGFGALPYVSKHFADRETKAVHPEHSKVSGYFNFDDGTGKIRGVYLQGNDMMRPVFEAWFAPFRDLGVTTVTVAGEYGSDQVPFDEAGLPGFQFIQDPVEYDTRTHHTNMDVYDRLQAGDLMQSAAVLASIVYHAANREERLPRKPMPAVFTHEGKRTH